MEVQRCAKSVAEHFICSFHIRHTDFLQRNCWITACFRHPQKGLRNTWQAERLPKAASPPFCNCGLTSHKWTVDRSTDWGLRGTSPTSGWPQVMLRCHTSSCCFHYPSVGHWLCTKSLRTELHLLCTIILLPLVLFYCSPITLTLPPDFVLARMEGAAFPKTPKSSKSFYMTKIHKPQFPKLGHFNETQKCHPHS